MNTRVSASRPCAFGLAHERSSLLFGGGEIATSQAVPIQLLQKLINAGFWSEPAKNKDLFEVALMVDGASCKAIPLDQHLVGYRRATEVDLLVCAVCCGCFEHCVHTYAAEVGNKLSVGRGRHGQNGGQRNTLHRWSHITWNLIKKHAKSREVNCRAFTSGVAQRHERMPSPLEVCL